MKKKLTSGEKRESRLRYLYRVWIRTGIIKVGTPMRLVRDVLNNKITLNEKKPRRVKIKSQITKKQRRKTRKTLKSKFINIIQRAKKVRRERRKANYEEKREATRVLRLLAEKQVRSLLGKLHGKPRAHPNLSGVRKDHFVRKGKGKKVIHEEPS